MLGTSLFNIFKKWLIIPILVGIVVYIVVSFIPKKFESNAKILPHQSGGGGGGAAALLSQFTGGMGLNLGGGGDLGQKIMLIFKTRKLAENVLDSKDLEEKLKKYWGVKEGFSDLGFSKKSRYIGMLRGMMSFDDDKKSGMITVSCMSKDIELSAVITNTYLDELQNMLNKNTYTSSKRNRVFLEKQLDGKKKELLEVGKVLHSFNDIYGQQSKVEVSYTAGSITKADKGSDSVVSNVPKSYYFNYLQAYVGQLTEVLKVLSQQYEIAKIEEKRKDISFEVLDKAIPIPSAVLPNVLLVVFLSVFSSIVLEVGVFFVRTYKFFEMN